MVDAREGGGEVLVVLMCFLEEAIELGVAEGGVGVAGGGWGWPVGVFEGVGEVVGGLLVIGADAGAGGGEEAECESVEKGAEHCAER